MQNVDGDNVDLYIPRKCSATNRLITATDHASVQLTIGEVDSQGRYTGSFHTIALGGFVRSIGESDMHTTLLSQKAGLIKKL